MDLVPEGWFFGREVLITITGSFVFMSLQSESRSQLVDGRHSKRAADPQFSIQFKKQVAWWSGNMLPSGQALSLIKRELLEEIPGSNPGAALFVWRQM